MSVVRRTGYDGKQFPNVRLTWGVQYIVTYTKHGDTHLSRMVANNGLRELHINCIAELNVIHGDGDNDDGAVALCWDALA